MSEKENYSPYCPICEACGEDGCCSANMCKQDPNGHYCSIYTKDMKLSYNILKDLDEFLDDNKEKYQEVIDFIGVSFDKHWDRVMKNNNDNEK
jgi:hypothetical protein